MGESGDRGASSICRGDCGIRGKWYPMGGSGAQAGSVGGTGGTGLAGSVGGSSTSL